MTATHSQHAEARPLRALFVNQGAVGSTMLGHLSVEQALRAGMRDVEDIESCFVRLAPWPLAARGMARRVPLLHRFDLDAHDVRWHMVEAVRGRRAVRARLRRYPADVVHVDSHTAALGMRDMMHETGILLSVDATVSQWRRLGGSAPVYPHSRLVMAPSRMLERRIFDAAAGVVARSDWAAEGVRAVSPGARVEVIHPGIDLGRFRPKVRSDRVRPRILFVGGRFQEKGGQDLLRAVGPVLGTQVDLDVVTSADIAPRDGLTVHRLSPGDADLVRLYQEADVFCMPTRSDSFGWVLLEAMACGTTVVSSPVGAIPDLLRGGEAGTLVAPGDVDALRRTLLDLVQDAPRREELAKAGLRVVSDGYDQRRQGQRLADVIRRTAT